MATTRSSELSRFPLISRSANPYLAEHNSHLPILRKAAGWVLALVVFIIHLSERHPGYSEVAAACSGLLAVAAILAATHARLGVLPALQVLLLHLYLSLGTAVFWPPVIKLTDGRLRLSSRSLDEATMATLLFTIVAALAFWLASRSCARFAPGVARLLDRHEYTPLDSAIARIMAAFQVVVFCLLNVTDLRTPIFGSLTYAVTLLSLPSLPLGLLIWDIRETNDMGARILLWSSVVVMSFIGLSTGMLGSAITPFVSLCLLTWTIQGRLPGGALIMAVILLLSLNSAKHVYRRLSWRGGPELSLSERSTNWVEAINQTYRGSYAGQEADAFSESAESTAGRMHTLPQVAHIFDWVPARIPHAGAEQWLKLPLEFVPRAIWPDKPLHIVEYNQRYTLTFRLQNRTSIRTTAVALPPVGDGYWRLGWFGVVIEGALLGLLAGLYKAFSRPDSRSLAIISCAAVASMSADAHVMAYLSGLPQFAIAMAAVFVTLNGAALLAAATKRRRFVVRRATQKLSP